LVHQKLRQRRACFKQNSVQMAEARLQGFRMHAEGIWRVSGSANLSVEISTTFLVRGTGSEGVCRLVQLLEDRKTLEAGAALHSRLEHIICCVRFECADLGVNMVSDALLTGMCGRTSLHLCDLLRYLLSLACCSVVSQQRILSNRNVPMVIVLTADDVARLLLLLLLHCCAVLEAKTLPNIFAGERGPEKKKGELSCLCSMRAAGGCRS